MLHYCLIMLLMIYTENLYFNSSETQLKVYIITAANIYLLCFLLLHCERLFLFFTSILSYLRNSLQFCVLINYFLWNFLVYIAVDYPLFLQNLPKKFYFRKKIVLEYYIRGFFIFLIEIYINYFYLHYILHHWYDYSSSISIKIITFAFEYFSWFVKLFS